MLDDDDHFEEYYTHDDPDDISAISRMHTNFDDECITPLHETGKIVFGNESSPPLKEPAKTPANAII